MLEQILEQLVHADRYIHKTVTAVKNLGATTAYTIGDVMSESATVGTAWKFNFGGPGYITKAVAVSVTTGMTARLIAQCYSRPPTCNLNDEAPSTGPVPADIPFFLGTVDFPAMTDIVTGPSYTTATPSTYGNLPLEFNVPIVYVVLASLTADDFLDGTLFYLSLSAEIEVI